MYGIEERFHSLINLINLINLYFKALYLPAAKLNVTSDLSGVPLRGSVWRKWLITEITWKGRWRCCVLTATYQPVWRLNNHKHAQGLPLLQRCTMSYFQTHSEHYYYHSRGILRNPRGSHFVTGTQHVPLPPSVLAQTHHPRFPRRARWRCVSPAECNLAGPLSLVSSVTLCSHSIRAPRLRGAADKILIILAHRIKGTRTEGWGRGSGGVGRGLGCTHTYKHFLSLSLKNANLTRWSTVNCYRTPAHAYVCTCSK